MSTRHFAPPRWLWVFALLLSSASLALAQTTVSGTITDGDNDETLIGANVIVPGTSIGTATDFDGNFELTVPEGTTQLAVSYAGYQTQTIDLTPGQTTYNLSLSAGELLEEVVVVGYGTQTQSEVTSAVTSVSEKDFNVGVVNNPTQLVQGKVAGLQIAQVGGDPNGQPTIRLRGLSTIGANAEPLVIIDGVIGASLNTVDPSDIASIDVLKDGSAAAIYGTRASSGVIIVTTKSGRDGETRVTYRVQGGVETVAKSVPVASPERFVELRGPAADFGARNDIFDEVTRPGFSHIHNLSFSGGAGSGNYRASINYRDVNGVSEFSGFDQLNARLNVRQRALDDKLSFDLSASATTRDAELGFNDAFRYATIYNPTIPLRLEPGFVPERGFNNIGGFSQVAQFDYFNPVAINEQNSNTRTERDFLISGRIGFEPIEGLQLSAQYSTNIRNVREFTYYANNSFYVGVNQPGNGGQGTRNVFEDSNNLFEATANYDFDIGNDNGLSLLAGYSYQQLDNDFFNATGGDFISNVTGARNFGIANTFRTGQGTVNSNGDQAEIESFFGRASLDIADTYFLQASVRSDGSTRFGANEKRGIFPAISGGVNFAGLIDNPDVNSLKLRAGYGVTGNLPQASLLAQTLYDPAGSFFFDGGFIPTFGPNRNANPDLRFERKGELNVGVDFAFLNYRLTGTLDYFNRRTTDLFLPVSVPVPPNLSPITFANLDDVAFSNEGFEFSLGYEVANTETFSYSPRIVFSSVRTKLDSVDVDDPQFSFFTGGGFQQLENTSPGSPGANGTPTQIIRPGEELGQFYGPVFEGINDDGSYRYVDLNGDGMIDNPGSGLGADRQVIGNGLPDFTLGFANEFRFGNFDANLFFRGAFGHDLLNLNRFFYENVSPARGTDNIVITELFDERLTAAPEYSDLYIEDASFVSLDNASIGYTVTAPEGSLYNSIRFAVAGQRLFYITDYTGVDPEVRYADPGRSDRGSLPENFFAPNALAPGIDRRYNYFRTRSFNLSVSVNF